VKRISFNPRFVNAAGDDLVSGKMHTIRQNHDYWKRFEGRDVALFTWEGKPYRSKQKVFCVKRLVSVQKVIMANEQGARYWIKENGKTINPFLLAKNDGFTGDNWDGLGQERAAISLNDWFAKYPRGEMAILHFTEFRY
jgi:hypothetical protein